MQKCTNDGKSPFELLAYANWRLWSARATDKIVKLKKQVNILRLWAKPARLNDARSPVTARRKMTS